MPAHIYIDADACPVRDETYKVARRHRAPVTVVSNSFLRVPREPGVSLQVVSDGFDAADDWIAERADAHAVVITSDILLADRCLKAGASVLSPKGEAFTLDSIGAQIATRAIMTDLRDQMTGKGNDDGFRGGPAPFTDRDRSKFLQALHSVVERLQRS